MGASWAEPGRAFVEQASVSLLSFVLGKI